MLRLASPFASPLARAFAGLAQLLLLLSQRRHIACSTTSLESTSKRCCCTGSALGVLATNLANADTPNYKARDIDFSAVLSQERAAPLPLSVTARRAHHVERRPTTPSAELKYRNPYQASLDGNTVEMPVEQAAFSENNVRYQASLGFINLQDRGADAGHQRPVVALKERTCLYSMYSIPPAAH